MPFEVTTTVRLFVVGVAEPVATYREVVPDSIEGGNADESLSFNLTDGREVDTNLPYIIEWPKADVDKK